MGKDVIEVCAVAWPSRWRTFQEFEVFGEFPEYNLFDVKNVSYIWGQFKITSCTRNKLKDLFLNFLKLKKFTKKN
jgi:hypothetical protein